MKTTSQNTKSNLKTSVNVSRETLKNNKKVEGKTMNTTVKKTMTKEELHKAIEAIKTSPKYDGTNYAQLSKGKKKATAESLKKNEKARKESIAKNRGGKLANVDIKTVEGTTDFDKLANLITAYYSDIATATKKAVRFKFIGGKIVCWRRVNNIRVYTDNTDLLPLEWVEDTHEIGYTHSAYTSYLTLAKLITANATPVIKA